MHEVILVALERELICGFLGGISEKALALASLSSRVVQYSKEGLWFEEGRWCVGLGKALSCN